MRGRRKPNLLVTPSCRPTSISSVANSTLPRYLFLPPFPAVVATLLKPTNVHSLVIVIILLHLSLFVSISSTTATSSPPSPSLTTTTTTTTIQCLTSGTMHLFRPARTAAPGPRRAHPAAVEVPLPGQLGPAVAALQARADGCLANFFSCSSQGEAFKQVCCANGQRCALDANNKPACCPQGAVCTGVAPDKFTTPTSIPPAAISFVPNTYFSFPYIATSFADPGDCSSAVSQCSSNYAACTSELEGKGAGGGGGQKAAEGGGGYAVTIVVPGGGGTTVAPVAAAARTTTLLESSATSVCASLSSEACSGLREAMCTAGASASGFVVGSGTTRARPSGLLMLAAAAALLFAWLGFVS